MALTTHSATVQEIIKSTPPLTAVGATLLGFPLSDWVLFFTLLYTVLQIFVLVKDKIVKRNQDKEPPK